MAVPEENLNDFLDKQQGVTKPGFIVDDDKKAEWALRKLSNIRTQQARIAKEADDQVQVIRQWEQEQTKHFEHDIEYFTGLLIAYAHQKRKENKKFKTLKLPHGKIGWRKQQPKWELNDQVAEWLDNNGHHDLVRIKPELSKIKKSGFIVKNGKLIDPDSGEIVPGVKVYEREDKPIVDPIEAKKDANV